MLRFERFEASAVLIYSRLRSTCFSTLGSVSNHWCWLLCSIVLHEVLPVNKEACCKLLSSSMLCRCSAVLNFLLRDQPYQAFGSFVATECLKKDQKDQFY